MSLQVDSSSYRNNVSFGISKQLVGKLAEKKKVVYDKTLDKYLQLTIDAHKADPKELRQASFDFHKAKQEFGRAFALLMKKALPKQAK